MLSDSTKLAIDLVLMYYNTNEPFVIQELLEEELDMEVHINDILTYLDVKSHHVLQN